MRSFRPRRSPCRYRPFLKELEERNLLSNGWTPVAQLLPGDFPATMLLLPNGTVMVQGQTPSGVSANWYQLTPDSHGSYINGSWSSVASMNTARLYYGSQVLPNGNVFVVGGEYSGNPASQNITNTSEMYNPSTNTWTNTAPYPVVISGYPVFGDDPTAVLPNGTVLGGYIFGPQTYAYNPTTNSWNATGTKIHNDPSDEESWAKLPNGKILSYDIFNSIAVGNVPGTAEVYDPSTDSWSATGSVPVQLTSSSVPGDSNFYEVGPAVLLPNGKVLQIGATPPSSAGVYTGGAHTALYDPVSNTWTAGPDIPLVGYGNDDAPAAVLPDGNVVFAADVPFSHHPTVLFEYHPTTNTITQLPLDPSLQSQLNSVPGYVNRMVMLPNGQLLLVDDYNQLWTYSESGTVNSSWRPQIAGIANNGGGNYTLNGYRFNGMDEGSYYGDDVQNSTNYPIVRLTSSSGNVYYATTSNWSSVWVQTGSTPVTTDFQLPNSIPAGTYSMSVIANGIPSYPIFLTVSAPSLAGAQPLATLADGQAAALTSTPGMPLLDAVLTLRPGSVQALRVEAVAGNLRIQPLLHSPSGDSASSTPAHQAMPVRDGTTSTGRTTPYEDATAALSAALAEARLSSEADGVLAGWWGTGSGSWEVW